MDGWRYQEWTDSHRVKRYDCWTGTCKNMIVFHNKFEKRNIIFFKTTPSIDPTTTGSVVNLPKSCPMVAPIKISSHMKQLGGTLGQHERSECCPQPQNGNRCYHTGRGTFDQMCACTSMLQRLMEKDSWTSSSTMLFVNQLVKTNIRMSTIFTQLDSSWVPCFFEMANPCHEEM